MSGQLQDEGGSPEGTQQELGRPGARTSGQHGGAAKRGAGEGGSGAHIWKGSRGSQGARECGVTPRGRGSKATVWTLDFTLRTRGRGYTGEGVENGAGGAELSKGWWSRQEAGSPMTPQALCGAAAELCAPGGSTGPGALGTLRGRVFGTSL